jgi:DNA-binding MarR family transcriptional regulator
MIRSGVVTHHGPARTIPNFAVLRKKQNLAFLNRHSVLSEYPAKVDCPDNIKPCVPTPSHRIFAIRLISTYTMAMDTKLSVSPIVVDAECFCLNLKRAARAVARRYDEALGPVDLTNGQFSTLIAIAGLQPVSMQILAERLGMDRTTLTATLKPLQRRGLISIRPDTADRRSRSLTLTDEGAVLLRDAVPLWKKVQQAVGRIVGNSSAPALRAQLTRLA